MNDLTDTEKVFTVVLGFVLFLFLGFALLAIVGAVIAYFWNNFLVPNVDSTLPVITWWQAAIGLWLVRILKNVLFGK